MDTMKERQKVEENFQLKVCFRHFYDKAKKFYNAHLIISLIIPVVAVIARIAKFEYRDAILSLSSCWIIIAMLLTIWEQKLRLKAVILQEKYDIDVFGLKENKTLMSKGINIDEITIIVRKMQCGRGIDKIYYDGIECSNDIKAMLLAQRQNVVSDRFLREKYCFMYKLLLIAIVVMIILIGVILNQTVKELLIETLIPLISLISFVIQQIRKLVEEIKRNEQIGELIDSTINEYNNSKEESREEYLIKCREFQNYIFTRRLNAALIPNFIYHIFKRLYIDNKKNNQTITSEARDVS
ncbi:S-4TM family putative pore-forming effector [Bacillus cereus]|uniref:S-4TM family putative pore-forming effector n=1 Tax=Bacillus cereus TaxID=1396 RepID=UPI002405258C|nr:S-4TM family putative pore-forming effector [Bacillus cereus]MDF9528434.1 S-4TM family putative pore-forming effector [Bacillus cereus]MDG1576406.1 S-4TM family putative pore-forming effector [Bacillus cereus]